MGKVIGIISIKGGVGKTSCTANLGAALAGEFNQKVLVVDANFTAPNLAFHLGLADPDVTLHDVLSNKVQPHKAIFAYEKNLHILPGSLLRYRVNPFKLREKIYKLRSDYDIILLDSSPNLNDELLATMLAADELLVITSPDFPTLSCTMHAIKIAKEKKTPIVGLILNRVHNRSFELSLEEIEKTTGVPVIGFIPEDINVLESLAATSPATLYSPSSPSSVEFKKIAAALVHQDYADPRFFARLKKWFSSIPQKQEINRDLLREGKLY